MNTLTIFTTGPDCHKCILTKAMFNRAGVFYTDVRLDDPVNAGVAADFIAAGHGVAPVVVDRIVNETWSDFRRDKIKASIKARQ